MKKSLWLLLAAAGLLAFKPKSDRILIKLIKGQKYMQHMVTKTSTTQTIMGKETTSLSISDVVCKYEIVDVSDSIYTLKVTYESISAKIIKDGDSAIATKNSMSPILHALKGKSYLIKMSNAGNIIKTIGADSLMADLSKKLPGLAKQFSDSYGDKGIKQKATLGMNMYPQKAVKEGDSWTVTRQGENNVMSPQIDATYKLDKITGSEYLISGKLKIRIGSGDSSKLSSVPMQFDMTGSMNSISKIDKRTGLVTETKIDQDITGTLKMKEGATALGGTTIPMHIISEIVVINSLI